MRLRYKLKAFAALVLAAVITMLCTACDDDGKDYIFKYDIAANPRTLDPQTANDDSSLQLISNIFDGLLRLDSEGNVEPAVAESWEVSEDGLTYRFKLREDVYWYDGNEFEAQCTADDFVFAFQRLFKPSTKSQVYESFLCIKNAEEINMGWIEDLDELGVKAEDDFTLAITLAYPNPMFPILLTTAPAMPCNRIYYESTGGKYGLYADKIASNGAFYVYSWSYDKWSSENNNIIMRRNVKNNADESICPYGLNYFIDEDDEYANFLDEQSHVYITSGAEAVTLIEKGYSYVQCDNRVWGILFNTAKTSVFNNESLRQALAYGVDRESAVLEATGYTKAYNLIPDSISVGVLNYREQYPQSLALVHNDAMAQAAYDKAAEEIDKNDLNGITLIMPEDEALQKYVSYITQQWQSSLNFYCNIKVLSQSAFLAALQDGDFDIALSYINGSYNNPSAYLKTFTDAVSDNYSGYRDSSYKAVVTNGERASSDEKSAEYYAEAEEYILNKAVFIPLAYQSEYAFFGEDCSDIIYNPFTKAVVFREAKHK